MNKKLVHSVFENTAVQNPHNIAIESGLEKLTYFELNSASNKLSQALSNEVISKEEIIGAFFETGFEYVTSILGINKAGGAFMPIEPGFPIKRLNSLLNTINPSIILTTEKLLPALLKIMNEEDSNVKLRAIFAIDFLNGNPVIKKFNKEGKLLGESSYSDENLNLSLTGDETSYIIYTSGSTGSPKIIEGVHKGLSHFIHWEIGEFKLDKSVRVSQLAPISFDVSLRDIFVPLLLGGTLCIPGKDIKFQPHLFLEWISTSKLTLIHSVPTLFRLLTEEIKEKNNSIDISSLQYILLAGEPLFGRDVLNWRKAVGESVELVNIYGPSETTLAKMFHRINGESIAPDSIVPLGKPISNTAVLILNDGRLCHKGEPGKLYIKTPFRSKGYYKNQQLTKEKFIQNPLHNDFEDIIYDTGDLSKYLENMDVAFLGRQDNQIKIRGNRIELLEIEKHLITYSSIKEAAAIVVETGDEDKVIACYFTSDNKIEGVKLKEYLSDYLPSYMLPSHYIQMEKFPLNGNGKVDKKMLPAPAEIFQAIVEEPVSEIEKKLEAIWKEVLKLSQIGRNDSFFNIGGSSLKGIKIISKIYKECNILIKLPDLFENPTLKQLGKLLSGAESNSFNEITPVESQEYYDLSHGQRRLWILSHFEEENLAYNMTASYKFEGVLDVQSLESSLAKVVERHESLRTIFVSKDGEPKQKILSLEELKFSLTKFDLTSTDDPDRVAQKLVKDELRKPFNLSEGPLFKANLIQLEENEYIFFFMIHHIISDGWSFKNWIQEVLTLYNAYKENKENPLKPLKIQYKDFSVWQNKLLTAKELNKTQGYWVQQFNTPPPVLNLPSDKVRPQIKTFNGKHLGARITAEKVTQLKALSNKNDATLFMTLLTCVNVLFYRLTNQTDITIGSPIAGREHEGLEDQIGLFVNTLALRTKFTPDNSFAEVLKKVKEITTGAYSNQSYPFDYLVDQLNLVRDMSRSPLFDVMIVLHDTKSASRKTVAEGPKDLDVASYYLPPVSTKYDLNLNFTETENGHLNVLIEYNEDVFSHPSMQNIFNNLDSLISAVINSNDTPINSIDYLGDNEKRKLINDYNNTSISLTDVETVQELFERQVEKTPDATALQFGNEELSYREVNERANGLANYLKEKHSIKQDDLIAIMLERSPDLIVSILAVLKAGAAYVPIDTTYPKERILHILKNASVKLTIAEKDKSDIINEHADGAISLPDTWDLIGKGKIGNPTLDSKGSDLAYVIFTSGSTNKPKGVAIEHESLVNYILWANNYYFENQNGNTFALNTSISFDLTVTSIFSTLLRGDKLFICKNDVKEDEVLFEIFSTSNPVTVVKLTPSHISLLGSLPVNRTNVEIVIVGGEMLTKEQVKILRKLNPSIRIFNEYGPTETTVGCTVEEIKDNIIIGNPIVNTQVFILDENRNLVPVGVKGEICIGGKGLARGYYNDDLQTEKKFFYKKFSFDKEERLYATGDIGKWNLDGSLEIYGRVDRQAKIRGYRVELEEIESAVSKYESIKDSIVLIQKDDDGNDVLTAFYTSEKTRNISELRRYLENLIPWYMVPNNFVHLRNFPLTSHGKIDLKALVVNTDSKSTRSDKVFTAPNNELEEKLVAIWKTVLDKNNIGVNDNFFELGGHSLKAIRVVSLISNELEVEVRLKEFFANPTVKLLAAVVQSKREKFEQDIVPSTGDYFDLSHGTKGLYYKYLYSKKKTPFNTYNLVKIDNLNIKALEKTFLELIKRHEILRTTFHLIGEEPKQKVNSYESVKFEIEHEDLRSELLQDEKYKALLKKETKIDFDLENGPLLKVKTIRVGEDSYVVLVVMAHIICDAWSMEVLEKESLDLYNSFVEGNNLVLPEIKVQYKDYSVWQNNFLKGTKAESHLHYWRDKLSNRDLKLNLPVDNFVTYPADQGYRPCLKAEIVKQFKDLTEKEENSLYGVIFSAKPLKGRAYRVVIAKETHLQLKKLSLRLGVSLFNTLTTSVKTFLYKITGQTSITLGSPVTLRERVDLLKSVGWFLDTLILTSTLEQEFTIEEYIANVAANTSEALEHRVYPFEKILDELDISMSEIGAAFIHLLNFGEEGEGKIHDFNPLHKEGTPTFDINFTFKEYSNGLELTCDYRDELFNQETIERLIQDYLQLLMCFVDHPSATIQELVQQSALLIEK